MAKEPSQRYQNLDRLREDLAAVRGRLTGPDSNAPLILEGEAETAIHAGGSAGYTQPVTPASTKASGRPSMVGVARDSSIRERDTTMSSAPTISSRAATIERASTGSRATPGTSRLVALLGDEGRPKGLRYWGAALAAPPFRAAGAAAAALVVVLAVAFYWNETSVQLPPAGGERTTPSQQPAPAPTPSTVPGASQDRSGDLSAIEDRLRVIRATARRQIADGERQHALDTMSAGLVLDARDPELNGLIDELKRTARQMANRARTTAGRGAEERPSLDFQSARSRERQADSFDRAGNRTQAIRAYWEATELYDRASRVVAQSPTTLPPEAGLPLRPEIPKPETPPLPLERQPSAPAAPPPLETPPSAIATPPQPPASVTSEPVPQRPGEAAQDGRTLDRAAIEDTLRRYAEAYRSRDIAAVRVVLPSLNAQQMRSLEKDFSNYRSYNVEITDQRIVINHDRATATAQVTRSFITTNGVAGGHTVATVFRLRKIDASWVIDRLESR
jgi:hypothetical protein